MAPDIADATVETVQTIRILQRSIALLEALREKALDRHGGLTHFGRDLVQTMLPHFSISKIADILDMRDAKLSMEIGYYQLKSKS